MMSKRCSCLACLALLCLLVDAAALHAAADAACTVAAVSAHAGLTFTDGEPVAVRARVTGFTAAPVTVGYRVREWEGPWEDAGQVTVAALADGAGEAPLPLRPPGRGLCRLTLRASDGARQAVTETSLAVLFSPPPVTEASPWGIFYIPNAVPGLSPPEAKRELARNIRLLGASWVRFNFWAGTFGKVTVSADGKQVSADWSQAREMVQALRAEGLYVMGEIAQCPRELSSRPGDTEVVGDAGPVYNRVKPADYALWDQLMRKLAADFAADIPVWEVWNEANLPNCYWTGTPEDFVELVRHTSRALKQGSPGVKVAAAGFTGGHDYADKLLTLGLGQELDILSVHYTDERPAQIEQWQALLRKHNLSLPLWNTEEKSEVPLENLASPLVRSFKFCHINIGYDVYRLLVNKDLTPRPPAVWYSVGAHLLEGARFLRREATPGCDVMYFDRPRRPVAVLRSRGGASTRLLQTVSSANLAVTPVTAGAAVLATDEWGRTTPLTLENGQATAPLRRLLFVEGAGSLRVTSVGRTSPANVVVAEAEQGRHGPGWGVTPHEGFSEGATLDIWSDTDPGPDGYWIELKLRVPVAGRYEVLFSGNALSRLKPPRSLSPFTWRFDDGEEHQANAALPMDGDVPGAPQGLSTLGQVELAAGEHSFRLRLSARRDIPDKHWALWFDALALRPL